MKQKKNLSMVFVLLAGFIWGCTGLFVRKLNAAGLYAMDVIQIRITIGMLLLFFYLLIFARDKLKVKLRDLWCFFGTGVCSLLFFSWCYFTGLGSESIAVMGVLLYTAPAFVLLFSALLFGERLTAKKLVVLGLTVAGCCLVSGIGGKVHVSLRGLLLGLGAGLGYGSYSIYGRYAIKKGYDAWTITFYTFLFCSAGGFLLSDWGHIYTVATIDSTAWIWMLAMALLSGFAAYLLYTMGLQGMESSKASIIASVEPVVGTLLGVTVFHEALTLPQILGICLVLCSIVLLNVQLEKRRGRSDLPNLHAPERASEERASSLSEKNNLG